MLSSMLLSVVVLYLFWSEVASLLWLSAVSFDAVLVRRGDCTADVDVDRDARSGLC